MLKVSRTGIIDDLISPIGLLFTCHPKRGDISHTVEAILTLCSTEANIVF